MPFNKIGGGVPLQIAPVQLILAGGENFLLPVGQGTAGAFGTSLYQQLGAGAFSGQYLVGLGTFSQLDVYDPSQLIWRKIAGGGTAGGFAITVSADGVNFRVSNPTGVPLQAGTITAAGSGAVNGFYGYKSGVATNIVNGSVVTTAGPTVSATDGSTWNIIIGGSVSTTLSFAGTVYASSATNLATFGTTTGGVTASAGSGYTARPTILFGPPPNQGQQPYILPTAVCTITAGAIATVTVTSGGAGLLALPTVTVIPAPGDTTGGGAVLGWLAANDTQVGSGGVTAFWLNATGATGTVAPTLTLAGGGLTAATGTAAQNATAATNDTLTLVSI